MNGYIEEMVSGQKVVKVFAMRKGKEEFDALNEKLQEEASAANVHANILMPIMGNLGHLYVLIAMVGRRLPSAAGGLTLGGIAASCS